MEPGDGVAQSQPGEAGRSAHAANARGSAVKPRDGGRVPPWSAAPSFVAT
jgi:hypothetical protein